MKTLIKIFTFFTLCNIAFGHQKLFNPSYLNSVESNDVNPKVFLQSDSFFIFPGTKWCGAGNVAENNDDLGSEWEADVCCRTHDFCPDIMEGHETKNNLTNPDFYTRLNCGCDYEFFKCLKMADTKTSRQVGQIYFSVLGTQCYKRDYPIVGCQRRGFFPRFKCLIYEQDPTQEPIYQWFDLPNFN